MVVAHARQRIVGARGLCAAIHGWRRGKLGLARGGVKQTRAGDLFCGARHIRRGHGGLPRAHEVAGLVLRERLLVALARLSQNLLCILRVVWGERHAAAQGVVGALYGIGGLLLRGRDYAGSSGRRSRRSGWRAGWPRAARALRESGGGEEKARADPQGELRDT